MPTFAIISGAFACVMSALQGYEYVSSDCLDKHQRANDLLMSRSGGTEEELYCAAQAHTVPKVFTAVLLVYATIKQTELWDSQSLF